MAVYQSAISPNRSSAQNNPLGESHVLTQTSAKELYKAHIITIPAFELIYIHCYNNVNTDNIPIMPSTTLHEALKAASQINSCTEHFLNHLIAPII
jgi:hypothetical protein